MDKVVTIAVLRTLMNVMFPDVDDGEDDENVLTAVGIVLLSAAIIGSTDATKLISFNGYSLPFISAITINEQNNQLWVDSRYDASTWLSSDGTIDDECLWEHVDFACGDLRMPTADPKVEADPCRVFWDERPPT